MATAVLGQAILGQMTLGDDGSSVFWQVPKTDWKSTDRLNYADFNRIRGNIMWLHKKAQELCKAFELDNMGAEINSYKARWKASDFNAFETNLEKINNAMYTQDFGASQTFYPNGVFIGYSELNRIENACLNMKDVLDRQEKTLRRLGFRLGNYKGFRV